MTYKDLMETPVLSPVDVELWYTALTKNKQNEEYYRIASYVVARDLVPGSEKGDSYKRNKEILRVLDILQEETPTEYKHINPVKSFFETEKGKNILNELSEISDNGKMLIDTSKTPWIPSSTSAWGYVALILTEKLKDEKICKIYGDKRVPLWKEWAELIGTDKDKLRKNANNFHQKGQEAPKVYTDIQKAIKQLTH